MDHVDPVDIEALRNAPVSFSEVETLPEVSGPVLPPLVHLVDVARRVLGLFA